MNSDDERLLASAGDDPAAAAVEMSVDDGSIVAETLAALASR